MKILKNTAIALMITITALLPCSVTALAVSTDSIISKLIMTAEDEVGYTGTSTYSKYGEWYGYQGGWCSTFALWCFNKTGESLGVKLYGSIVPNGGNCSSMISWFTNKGRYHTSSSGYSPKRGDLAFFTWNGKSVQHVGIVTGVSGSTIYTVEGNCSGKVKSRSYSPSGSKPYGSTSSILGYGNPNYGAAGSAQTTTAKPSTTAKKSTTKKQKTTKRSTTKRTTTKKATTARSTTAKKTTAKATTAKKQTAKKNPSSKKKKSEKKTSEATTALQTTAAPETTTGTTTAKPAVKAEDMTIHAATNTLQVGDSVQLNYEITPADSSAAVGYFCDEDDIVDVSETGVITAKETGTATVVVCANDEIYRQCNFTVTSADAQVTTKSADTINTIPYIGAEKADEKSQMLSELGVNSDKLISHKKYYAVPLCIIGATGVTVLCIEIVKAAAKSSKKRRMKKEEESKND